jgi:hypothetical protein
MVSPLLAQSLACVVVSHIEVACHARTMRDTHFDITSFNACRTLFLTLRSYHESKLR